VPEPPRGKGQFFLKFHFYFDFLAGLQRLRNADF
jgi:hypothetical protein